MDYGHFDYKVALFICGRIREAGVIKHKRRAYVLLGTMCCSHENAPGYCTTLSSGEECTLACLMRLFIFNELTFVWTTTKNWRYALFFHHGIVAKKELRLRWYTDLSAL